jgi:hypothetical protein
MIGFARGLHYLSILLTVIIAFSWILFAVDEIGDASASQTEKIALEQRDAANGDNSGSSEDEHGVVRRTIDDAADQLTSPFSGIVADDASVWAIRTVPTVLGLLLYGVGLAVLSRWLVTRV